MADPNGLQLDDVAFESGIDANGDIAAASYWTWTGGSPPTYRAARSLAHKWSNDADGVTASATSAAGTSGGTITYSFGTDTTPTQQAAFTSTLALWSDETDVSFKLVPLTDASDVVFDTNTGQGTFSNQSNSAFGAIGSSAIPSYQPPGAVARQSLISFDTSGRFGTIGSFADGDNFSVGALTHEVGHSIGLGHSGAYNDAGVVTPFDNYDDRQYSVMSYVVPTTGADWKNTSISQTPMLDDILAAQRLYGAPVGGGLSGGQVFGFNCNITDAAKPFFDFSTNINPVVTLYDSGVNNTLDCSGFSTSCTINLNPGTFSSASRNGMINNIAIAYGTRIDTAIGGSGDDTFIVNADNDVVDGGAGSNTANFAGAQSDYTVVKQSPTSSVVTSKLTGTADHLYNIQNLVFAPPVCFTTGTRIAVHRGTGIAEVPVEALRVGDLAVTATGGLRPICWIGKRTISVADHPCPSSQWPVRIQAGAFGFDATGQAMPARDLRLSPGHPVLVGADDDHQGGMLVPIMCLVNGTTVERLPADAVDYWHVELDWHDLLLAEGLAAESFFDCGTRAWFGLDSTSFAFDPDFAVPDLAGRCRLVQVEGPAVDAERRRLDMVFAETLVRQCGWGGEGFRVEG